MTKRFVRAFLAYGRLRTGDPCLERPEFADHVCAAVGDADAMFTCLRREVLRRHGWYVPVEPICDRYRQDPRFQELLLAIAASASIGPAHPAPRRAAAA